MFGFGRAVHAGLLGFAMTAVAAIGASAASASTFFVSPSGNDANPCTSPGAAACKTIKAAIEKSEVTPGTATIEVAAGTYQEELALTHAADNGIAINGVGATTVIEGPAAATHATVKIVGPKNTGSLSNLNVVNPVGDEKDGIEVGASVTLNNVSIDMQHAGSEAGIFAGEAGSITLNGGGVTMETGSTGFAITSGVDTLTANGSTVTLANGATGGGINTQVAPVSLTNVTVNLGNAAKNGGIQTAFGAISLSNVAVNVGNGSSSSGLNIALPAPLSANGVKVTMGSAASTAPAVVAVFGSGTFEHLEVGGAWKGSALINAAGDITLADSRLTSGPEATNPTTVAVEGGESRGLLVQRSILQAPATGPGALFVLGSNATVDSSEILGGTSGVTLIHEEGKTRTLTLAGSTIDAGVLGTRDGAGVFGVTDTVGGKVSVANVNIEGSILFEKQQALVGAGGNSANVTCSYSDVPNQTQAATATEGTINCANGAGGNTTTEPLTALFGPAVTNYAPPFGSTAIDSVPAGAIALPFGITPSATDLAGNPRVVDGNGDCLAVQDKGALELQGFSKACPPPPPPPKPPLVKPTITALSVTPNAFYAALSGAEISKTKKPAKKYGATISWRDSLAATATFTVLLETKGRMQGKKCKKPSKANRKGKRCTIYTAVGSFTHADVAGANKVHFSGRLKGKKLSKGSYVLEVVPSNTAGNGKAVRRQFKIKG